MVPARYSLVADASGVRLVVRVSNCESFGSGASRGRPGTIAHIGIMINSPDGTGTDPNVSFYTSSNNTIGQFLGSNRIAGFPLRFRGAYEFAEMIVSQNP